MGSMVLAWFADLKRADSRSSPGSSLEFGLHAARSEMAPRQAAASALNVVEVYLLIG